MKTPNVLNPEEKRSIYLDTANKLWELRAEGISRAKVQEKLGITYYQYDYLLKIFRENTAKRDQSKLANSIVDLVLSGKSIKAACAELRISFNYCRKIIKDHGLEDRVTKNERLVRMRIIEAESAFEAMLAKDADRVINILISATHDGVSIAAQRYRMPAKDVQKMLDENRKRARL